MILFTSTVGYDGPYRLDITQKSATTKEGRVVAPPWPLVQAHRDATRPSENWFQIVNWPADTTYAEKYHEILQKRYRTDPAPFLSLIQKDVVVAVCYCRTGHFCHRRLLAIGFDAPDGTGWKQVCPPILKNLCEHHGLPFLFMGEISANGDVNRYLWARKESRELLHLGESSEKVSNEQL